MSGLFLWITNWVDLRISWLNLLWKSLTLWVLSFNVKDGPPCAIPIFFLSDLVMFVYTQMFSLTLLFCILGEYAWFDMTDAFFVLATWPNKPTLILIHWYPLWAFKPLFLVLSLLHKLGKKKTMFYLRKKEGANGLCSVMVEE